MRKQHYRGLRVVFLFFAGAAFCWAETNTGGVKLIEGIGETDASYHLFIPESQANGVGHPVVYAFHPSGNGEAMLNRLFPIAEEFGWVIVGCNYLRNRMNDNYSTEFQDRMAREIMEDVEARVKIDPTRRYMAGLSGGAMRAYGISSRFERDFAGILAFVGWLGIYDDEERAYPSGMAVAIINGRSDRGAERYRLIDTEILERNGVVVRAFFFDGGHQMPPGPESILEAVGWLESLARERPKENAASLQKKGQR